MVIELTLEAWFQVEVISLYQTDPQLGLKIAAVVMLVAHYLFLLNGLLSLIEPFVAPEKVHPSAALQY